VDAETRPLQALILPRVCLDAKPGSNYENVRLGTVAGAVREFWAELPLEFVPHGGPVLTAEFTPKNPLRVHFDPLLRPVLRHMLLKMLQELLLDRRMYEGVPRGGADGPVLTHAGARAREVRMGRKVTCGLWESVNPTTTTMPMTRTWFRRRARASRLSGPAGPPQALAKGAQV